MFVFKIYFFRQTHLSKLIQTGQRAREHEMTLGGRSRKTYKILSFLYDKNYIYQ